MSRHWIAFFGIAAAVIVADQLSKAWIVANFPFGEPVDVIGDVAADLVRHELGRPVRALSRPGRSSSPPSASA